MNTLFLPPSPPIFLDKKIDFGFVLLPDETTSKEIVDLVKRVITILKNDSLSYTCSSETVHSNSLLRLSHISLGQYGINESELPVLNEIIKDAANKFSLFIEEGANKLSVIEENIFFDLKNIFHNTNPELVNLYCFLRESYKQQIKTRFPIN